jgi:hypothetical protein
MAAIETATNTPAPAQPEHLSTALPAVDLDELTPFERIVARMKGTGRIVGGIVSPDPEPWDCEIE